MSEEVKKLQQQIAFLEGKLAYYEEDGPAKLYYSLIRKSNEMAELLNRTSLLSIELVDAKNKELRDCRSYGLTLDQLLHQSRH